MVRADRSEWSGETEGETKRPEGAERKTLAHKLEDSKVIDYRGLLHDLYVVYI